MKNGVKSSDFSQIPEDFAAELQRFARVLAGFEHLLTTGYAQILSHHIPIFSQVQSPKPAFSMQCSKVCAAVLTDIKTVG